MGEKGPPPKRSDQRRRTNAPETPIDRADGGEVVIPDPDEEWHPIARMMWDALGTSGQSVFYESTDWSLAFALCESMSREFKPQVVGSSVVEVDGEKIREPIWAEVPPKAAALASWSKMTTSLLVAEGDRRRAGLELNRPEGEEEVADVDDLTAYRDAARNAG